MIAAAYLLAGIMPLAPLPVHPSPAPVRQIQACHLTGQWDFNWSRVQGRAWLHADGRWQHQCGSVDCRGVWSLSSNGDLDIVEYQCKRGVPDGEPLAYRLIFQEDADGCYDPVKLEGRATRLGDDWRYDFIMTRPVRAK